MYNLIYTQLTLHHCEDPSTMINLLVLNSQYIIIYI